MQISLVWGNYIPRSPVFLCYSCLYCLASVYPLLNSRVRDDWMRDKPVVVRYNRDLIVIRLTSGRSGRDRPFFHAYIERDPSVKSFQFAAAVFVLFCSSLVWADERGTLIFEDDFERSESQEQKDEIGKGWGTNSRSRAKGNKQVDLRDGAMYIYIHETADHAVSVTHPAEFKNGAVALRFMLEDPKDSLGLNFADLKYKPVHAGHLFVAKISPKNLMITDLKTGNMDLKIRDQRKAGTLSAEHKELLKTKTKRFPLKLETGKWYDLLVNVEGDRLTVSIDGKKVGSFASEGMAHPTKRLLRLAVPRKAVVDDVKIYSRGAKS